MPPFYVQMELIFLAASLLFCFLVYVFSRQTVPAVPLYAENRFPTVWDTLFTALFILVFVVSLASTLPMTEAEAQIGGMETYSVRTLILNMLVQALVYVPMVVRYGLLPRRERESLGFFRASGMVFRAFGFILLVSMVMGLLHVDKLIMELTGCPEQQDVVQSMMDGNAAQQAVLAVAAVIMAPIGEEICFRGFVYNILRQRSGVWPAAIASGLLFGAVHASLVQLLPLTIFGIVQCRLYEKSKTLLLPMAMHALFNSFSVACILAMPYLPEAIRNAV